MEKSSFSDVFSLVTQLKLRAELGHLEKAQLRKPSLLKPTQSRNSNKLQKSMMLIGCSFVLLWSPLKSVQNDVPQKARCPLRSEQCFCR